MTTSKRPVGTDTVHDYQVESKRLSQLLRDVGITASNQKYENLMQAVITFIVFQQMNDTIKFKRS